MYALLFTNTILGAYLTYILAEKKRNSFKNRAFWVVLLLLFLSLIITTSILFPISEMAMIKDTVFLP